MSDGTADVSRRGFLRVAAGGAAGSAAVGTAAGQENGTSQGTETGGGATGTAGGTQTGGGGNETSGGGGRGGGGGGGGPPDFGGYMSGANNFDGNVTDATGSAEVTVEVGAGDGLAFGPAAVHVDNGATVIWEWTGEGGTHNVVSDGDGPLDSGSPVAESGATYEYTFEEDGIYNYYCNPHQGQGMLGSVVVGSDYPTVAPATAAGPQVPATAKSLGVAATGVMFATLGLAWLFIKFGGDFGDGQE